MQQFATTTTFHWLKHNRMRVPERGLRICASTGWWHFLKDCIVTQTGIITHFHASFLPLWNVTPYWVSFRFALAALSPFHRTWVFLTLLGHYLLLSIFVIFVFISLPFPFPLSLTISSPCPPLSQLPLSLALLYSVLPWSSQTMNAQPAVKSTALTQSSQLLYYSLSIQQLCNFTPICL